LWNAELRSALFLANFPKHPHSLPDVLAESPERAKSMAQPFAEELVLSTKDQGAYPARALGYFIARVGVLSKRLGQITA